LKLWQKSGLEIAAHGWNHKAQTNKSFYHKIHSLIMSSNCAEHLSKNRLDIINIIRSSYNWFIDNGFKKPILYVPPAWALGKVNKEELYQFNFTHFECTTGMVHKQKYSFLPLLGFEENTLFGALLRRCFNALNFFMAHFTGTIRIAIHPNDFNLYLKKDLEKYLTKCIEPVLLHELS
jgi:predicted deacetylase